MDFKIVTPQETHIYAVAWIEVNTPAGNFVIQPGHAPTILILSQSKEMNFRLANGKQESFIVERGILEVTRSSATLIVSKAT